MSELEIIMKYHKKSLRKFNNRTKHVSFQKALLKKLPGLNFLWALVPCEPKAGRRAHAATTRTGSRRGRPPRPPGDGGVFNGRLLKGQHLYEDIIYIYIYIYKHAHHPFPQCRSGLIIKNREKKVIRVLKG